MSNEADFDAYRGGAKFDGHAVLADYAEALGMKYNPKIAAGGLGGNDPIFFPDGPQCEMTGFSGVDGHSSDPQAAEPITPSEPLVVGLTLRRIPDGGVLVTALDGEVVFCCGTVEEALEYVQDRMGG